MKDELERLRAQFSVVTDESAQEALSNIQSKGLPGMTLEDFKQVECHSVFH